MKIPEKGLNQLRILALNEDWFKNYSLLNIAKGLKALQNYNIIEIGSKRRLAAELENHKDDIISYGLQEDAIYLAEECHKTAERGWRDECQKFIEELRNQ